MEYLSETADALGFAPIGLDEPYRVFMTKDPLGEGSDTNLYRFVANSPANFIDTDGRILQYIGPAILIGVGGYYLYEYITNIRKTDEIIDKKEKALKKFSDACKKDDFQGMEEADQAYRDAVLAGLTPLERAAYSGAKLEGLMSGKLPKVGR